MMLAFIEIKEHYQNLELFEVWNVLRVCANEGNFLSTLARSSRCSCAPQNLVHYNYRRENEERYDCCGSSCIINTLATFI